MNCLSVFAHFMELTLKGLTVLYKIPGETKIPTTLRIGFRTLSNIWDGALIAKVVHGFQPLIVFAKNSFDVSQGSESSSDSGGRNNPRCEKQWSLTNIQKYLHEKWSSTFFSLLFILYLSTWTDLKKLSHNYNMKYTL